MNTADDSDTFTDSTTVVLRCSAEACTRWQRALARHVDNLEAAGEWRCHEHRPRVASIGVDALLRRPKGKTHDYLWAWAEEEDDDEVRAILAAEEAIVLTDPSTWHREPPC